MGFVTWISEGWSVFPIDAWEMFFVPLSQIFPVLAGQEDGWAAGDSLSMSLDTACEVRQGWAPLSGHKAGALSALWGSPSRSACLGGRLTHVGHSTEPFLLHRAKWAWHFPEKITQRALRRRRGKHYQCFLESPFFMDSWQSFFFFLTSANLFLFFLVLNRRKKGSCHYLNSHCMLGSVLCWRWFG